MSDTASKLNVTRFFTLGVDDVLGTVAYEKRRSVIKDPDGTVVFSLNDASIPSTWSQLATDIVVAKYFRKGGLFGDPSKGETGVRQVIDRIADPISKWAWSHGYVTSEVDRDNLRAELSYMLVNQIGAHNSPVWFNMGLSEKYQIKGSGGTWSVYDEAGTPRSEFKAGLTLDSYARPQTSACFIQSIKDNLVGPGGIFATLHTEAVIFKYGSGTGTNFSALRGKNEKLSGGGTSSGLMSYLEVFDRAAGSTKSGGVTRRAAKMVCLDLDHPEIIDFIECKLKEEKKVAALIAAGYPSDFNGDAYHTVAFQNANHSVRIPDSFFHALDANKKWSTHFRTTGGVCEELEASQLWQRLVHAAWACADPGVHYETTINDWHTVPNSAPIEASNPCSEYLHISDSACNLASLNLTKFLHNSEDGSPFFDVESYQKAVELFLLTQDILVDMASYPTEAIAQNSHDFRPLGLGYANLGTLLMMLGAPYDSDVGRSIAASVTAILTGTAYAMSAKIAKVKGPFAKFEHNREPMLRVMRKHQETANNISVEGSTTVA